MSETSLHELLHLYTAVHGDVHVPSFDHTEDYIFIMPILDYFEYDLDDPEDWEMWMHKYTYEDVNDTIDAFWDGP